MLVTLAGMVMLVKPLRPENALWPMLITPLGMVTLPFRLAAEGTHTMAVAENNTLSLTEKFVLAESTVMLVKPVQPENALVPMLVTLAGMVMLVKPLQLENALSPMLVTLFGMVILVRFVQFLNSSLPIEVIVVLGRIMDAICFKPASPGAAVLDVLPVINAPLLVL